MENSEPNGILTGKRVVYAGTPEAQSWELFVDSRVKLCVACYTHELLTESMKILAQNVITTAMEKAVKEQKLMPIIQVVVKGYLRDLVIEEVGKWKSDEWTNNWNDAILLRKAELEKNKPSFFKILFKKTTNN